MLIRVGLVALPGPPNLFAVAAEMEKGSPHPLSPSLFPVDDFWRPTAFLLADGCGYSGICLK